MHYFRLFFFLFFVFNSLLAQAQLSNKALLQPLPVKAENANELRAGLYVLGFSKNNEYFNKIADGYTLFGYHLQPKLIYFPSASIRIEAGALISKDFGNDDFQDLEPTFTAKVQRENWALLFGTLQGNLNHGYIEPLYDFERVITDRLENGLQFLLNTNRLEMDAWIDWQKMIYPGDPDREEVAGGASAALNLWRKEGKWGEGDMVQLSLPLQFTAQHKGGQIDASELPLLTVVNAATGIELERQYPFKVLHRLYTKNYIVGFKDFSNEYQLAYKSGGGIYLNAGIDTKYQDVMLSYWQGDGYISELGGKLYQSASTTYKDPDYVQEERRLLILRFMEDFELLDNLYLTVRLEPVVDLDNPKLEFSNAFYLTFDTDFFLAKPKR